MAAKLLLKALAATTSSWPRSSCPLGQLAGHKDTDARMYRGQAPIGALPSQHPAFHCLAKCRGVCMQHCMQNSTAAHLAITCDLNGLRARSRGLASGSPAGKSAAGAIPKATAGSAAAAVSGSACPAASCSLVWACMARTVRCQAAYNSVPAGSSAPPRKNPRTGHFCSCSWMCGCLVVPHLVQATLSPCTAAACMSCFHSPGGSPHGVRRSSNIRELLLAVLLHAPQLHLQLRAPAVDLVQLRCPAGKASGTKR